uniref:Uncharacterized protein n=1 Tax=Timema poppense TaxID=170557 RepID=A0A7R9DI62_TIMPO|nr:unnamed protein product [Timema poppensis]
MEFYNNRKQEVALNKRATVLMTNDSMDANPREPVNQNTHGNPYWPGNADHRRIIYLYLSQFPKWRPTSHDHFYTHQYIIMSTRVIRASKAGERTSLVWRVFAFKRTNWEFWFRVLPFCDDKLFNISNSCGDTKDSASVKHPKIHSHCKIKIASLFIILFNDFQSHQNIVRPKIKVCGYPTWCVTQRSKCAVTPPGTGRKHHSVRLPHLVRDANITVCCYLNWCVTQT